MGKKRSIYGAMFFVILVACIFVFYKSSDSQPVVADNSSATQVTKEYLLEIEGEEQFALWSNQQTESSTLEFDLNNRTKNIPLVLGASSHDGTEAAVTIGDWGYNLILLSNQVLDSAFNEKNQLKDGYYLQASTYDFDQDGSKEIFISIGNKKTELGIGIFKHFFGGFQQIGYIEGQSWSAVKKDGLIETYDEAGQVSAQYLWNGTDFTKK